MPASSYSIDRMVALARDNVFSLFIGLSFSFTIYKSTINLFNLIFNIDVAVDLVG